MALLLYNVHQTGLVGADASVRGLMRLHQNGLDSMTPKDRVLKALQGNETDMVPVTSLGGCGGTVCFDMQEEIGVYWPNAHQDAEEMTRLAITSAELSGLENVRVPFDFVLEPEALGCEIKWFDEPTAVPTIKTHPYMTPDELEMPDDLLASGRIPVVLEAIRLLKEEVGAQLPIAGTAIAPFTLAAELAGINNFIKWPRKEPERALAFVEFATEVCIEYTNALYDAGVDVVNLADPTAGLIGPPFREFAMPYLERVLSNTRGLKVLHICGRTDHIFKEMDSIGFDGLSLEIDDAKATKSIVKNTRILGNVRSSTTLTSGTPAQIRTEVKTALDNDIDLLEPDCGISPIAPLENVKAMVSARDEYFSGNS